MRFGCKSIAKILLILRDRDVSVPEIVEETGVSRDTVRTLCKSLHAEGLIYIAKWTLIHQYWSPSYRFGRNPDAAKIKPKRVRKTNCVRKVQATKFDPFFDICRP